jgi:spermidine synthase
VLALYAGIFLVSAATLAFEIILTRLFAVTQWHHFAFISVSVALLGLGASGTWLALYPLERDRHLQRCHTAEERDRTLLGRLAAIAGLFAIGILLAYVAMNHVPFDSYRLAWERRQFLYLALYYAALVVPFFFAGLCVGLTLAAWPRRANAIYASNLAGSAVGSLAVLATIPLLGGPGAVLSASALSMLAATVFTSGAVAHGNHSQPCRSLSVSPSARRWPLVSPLVRRWLLVSPLLRRWLSAATEPCAFGTGACWLLLLVLALRTPRLFELRLSPYKTLSTSMLLPDARLVFSRWNAFSRVEVVESTAIHSAPGLSLSFSGQLPRQLGLTVDGGNLSPITCIADPADGLFLSHLPTALPYLLRPQARALLIEPRGGLDLLVALHSGASSVVALESNPLVVQAVRQAGARCGATPYDDERVDVVLEEARSYLRRSPERYDIVLLSLSDTYQPVISGAYSLSESYAYTLEAFQDYVDHLSEDGLLVVTRWIQSPPSEELRACVLLAEALQRAAVGDPSERVVAFRTWSTATILAKRTPFRSEEIAQLKEFCTDHSFDLIYYPGITAAETNRYNVLSDTLHYDTFHEVLVSESRQALLRRYPYEVSPPSDDHPFFFHYFKWGQTQAILQQLGKTFQPFGGSGFLILVALLGLAVALSLVLILLPLVVRGRRGLDLTDLRSPKGQHFLLSAFCLLLYFFLLGLGYLFVEMPLLQQFILFVGQPTYSFSLVLFSILFFSGLGSLVAAHVPLRWSLPMLVVTTLAYPLLVSRLFTLAIGWPLAWRVLVAVLSLAPVGFLLGQPLPGGIRLLEERGPQWIPWAWAVNGCASVLSSILAVLGAVTWGFSRVLAAGAFTYLLAWGIIAFRQSRRAVVE